MRKNVRNAMKSRREMIKIEFICKKLRNALMYGEKIQKFR